MPATVLQTSAWNSKLQISTKSYKLTDDMKGL